MSQKTQEPFAWAVEISGTDKIFSSQKAAENARRRYEKVFDAERMEPFPLYRHPAPLSPDHSGGGAGMVAAEAFAKGFNTLETSGGKYKIVMQFAGHDDAWAAYTALGKLTACLDKVKELNQ